MGVMFLRGAGTSKRVNVYKISLQERRRVKDAFKTERGRHLKDRWFYTKKRDKTSKREML